MVSTRSLSLVSLLVLMAAGDSRSSQAFELRGPFSLMSVANPHDARTVQVNPAGLGTEGGLRGIYWHTSSDSSFEGDDAVFLGLGALGLGLQWLTTPDGMDYRRYTVAHGLGLSRQLFLGSSYSWLRSGHGDFDDHSTWDLGLLYWPSSSLSLGAVAHGINRPTCRGERLDRELDVGIALRPLTTHLTLTVEGRLGEDQRLGDIEPLYGIEIEPLRGLALSGNLDADGNFGLGLEINLAQVGAGVVGLFDDDSDYFLGATYLRFSQERYRPFVQPGHGFVELKLSGDIVDERAGGLFGGQGRTAKDILDVIQRAQRDPGVDGILLRLNNPSMGWGKRQEIREKLREFRDDGNIVVSYMESGGNGDYYLASVADRILLNPDGYLDLNGLRAEVEFYKGTLDKLGIKADLEHIGDYKTASDHLTRESMSEAHREVVNSLLDEYYEQFIVGIADGRGMSRNQARRTIDNGPFTAREAFEAGLVDTLIYEDEIEDVVEKMNGGKCVSIDGRQYARRRYRDYDWSVPPKIAVIYACGTIISGRSGSNPLPLPLIGGKHMGSETMAQAIKSAREDRSIKAIVLRVDSPGGSGLASGVIWREVMLAKEEKPVIVSMSDVAASGGYYIACAADSIVAEPGTITGSIGAISGKFSLRGLYDKLAINKEIIRRGERAAIYTDYQEFTPEEREVVRRQLREGYDDFVGKVAGGRGMSVNEVDSVAQGRVWTGRQAVQNGLVDELGGLDLALIMAKFKADIPEDAEIEIISLPQRRGFPFPMDIALSRLLSSSAVTDLVPWLDVENIFPDHQVLFLMPYSLDVR